MRREIRRAAQEANGELTTKRGKWEYIKYRMRKQSMKWGRKEAKKRRERLATLEAKLEELELEPQSNNTEIAEVKRQLGKMQKEEDKKAIFRARCEWVENNERCTKYFFRKRAINTRESNIIKLENSDGEQMTDVQINEEIHTYYKDLYTKRNETAFHPPISLRNRISEEDNRKLGKEVTIGELTRTLFKKMHAGKSPGNDGLTVGLYRKMWEEIKGHLHEALMEGLTEGELSPSQKQSIIRLIRKKDKNPNKVENFRPISLLNVDTKILSRTITSRLEETLPKVIGKEQLGFIKGRNIVEGTRTIEAVMESWAKEERGGIIAAFDFRKAFDSIAHDYIWRLLAHYGYTDDFIGMIKTLYKGAESAVMNNQTTTQYFQLGRSCRQGDALSPYLFILAIEPLLATIREDERIVGVRSPNGITIKTTAYADDITGIAENEEDIERMLKHLKDFKEQSGLEINEKKSEIMYYNKVHTKNIGLQQVNEVTITGVTHTNQTINKREMENKRFRKTLDKMKKLATEWKSRDISLLGRALVAKTILLSQLTYLMNSVVTPDWVIKEAKKTVYSYVWKGPPRICHARAALDTALGGLGLAELETSRATSLVQWIRRIATMEEEQAWMGYLREDLKEVGGYHT